MKWKKYGKALLFPPFFVMLICVLLAAGTLTYAMLYLEETNPLRIAAYVLSFYALIVLCLRFPDFVKWSKNFKKNNKYLQLWAGDVRLRMKITLAGSFLWNCGYAVLQLGLGIYHHAAWFYAFAGYYLSMAAMRLFLAYHTFHFQPRENMKKELKKYRLCGRLFLLMNLALSAMMLFMIRGERDVKHNEITTIAMATYTFATFAMAITNVVRYRKYNSPVYSATKAISLASASVSVMTLEDTMLSTFQDGRITMQTRKLFLTLTGAAIAALIVVMAVYMIVKSNREIKYLEETDEES